MFILSVSLCCLGSQEPPAGGFLFQPKGMFESSVSVLLSRRQPVDVRRCADPSAWLALFRKNLSFILDLLLYSLLSLITPPL